MKSERSLHEDQQIILYQHLDMRPSSPKGMWTEVATMESSEGARMLSFILKTCHAIFRRLVS